MKELLVDHRRVVLALIGVGMLAVLMLVLASGSSESKATSAELNSSFSILTPASSNVDADVPEKVKPWLSDVETNGISGLKEEPLLGAGTAQTPEGEVAVVQLGHNICLYAVNQGVSSCGDQSLIDEGRLLVVIPGCATSLVVGALPDQVRTVEAKTSVTDRAETMTINVSSNVYVAQMENTATALSAAGDKGFSFNLEMPFLTDIAERCKAT